MLYRITDYQSPVGRLILASDGSNLTGLWLEGQKYFGGTLGEHVWDDSPAVFRAAKDWLDRYFAGKAPESSELPLLPAGGSFRQTVWKLLCRIPYGEVTTYGTLAKMAAMEMGRTSYSAQAVGGAVGHNPISIVIPCHRVVGADGSLTGYAGGIEKKSWLLAHEGVDAERLAVEIRPLKRSTRKK